MLMTCLFSCLQNETRGSNELGLPRVQGIVLTGMSASSTQRAALRARSVRWDRSRVELRLSCCGHGACDVLLTLQNDQ